MRNDAPFKFRVQIWEGCREALPAGTAFAAISWTLGVQPPMALWLGSLLRAKRGAFRG